MIYAENVEQVSFTPLDLHNIRSIFGPASQNKHSPVLSKNVRCHSRNNSSCCEPRKSRAYYSLFTTVYADCLMFMNEKLRNFHLMNMIFV